MRYINYIALVFTLFVAACSPIEFLGPASNNGDDLIHISSRVKPFEDYVVTRANKTPEENDINSLDYLIFGTDSKCVFYQHLDGHEDLVLDRAESFGNTQQSNLSACQIYVVANFTGLEKLDPDTEIIGKTIDELSYTSMPVGLITQIPSTGLPMTGARSTYDNGTAIDLRTSATISPGHIFQVVLESLYAKIDLDISVDADQVIQEENAPIPTFTLTGYEVYNVAKAVDLRGGNESAAGKNDGSDDVVEVHEQPQTGVARGEAKHKGSSVPFSFYLPERFLAAQIAAEEYDYPFGTGTAIPADEERFRQYYKPKLVKDTGYDKKATYVTFKGVYSDHRGQTFSVSYDIYLGNDNYSNFDIQRNRQYKNTIIIRGIQNSSNQSLNPDAISIDHRVNVSRTLPIIINLRRETLLDSHFEIRPLRIRVNNLHQDNRGRAAGDGTYPGKVKVSVIYDETPSDAWIGLERSFGDGVTPSSSSTYLMTSDLKPDRANAAGKRKYFTTDLTKTTLASTTESLGSDGFSNKGGQTVTIPVKAVDECVWIYVDECLEQKDDVRSATIRIEYYDGEGNLSGEPIDYIINQRMLFPVTYIDGSTSQNYLIEYHEEYLYNYDADDSYGQTEHEGMQWGLMEVPISETNKNHQAILMVTGSMGSVDEDVYNALMNYAPYYDFYLARDVARDDWYFESDAAYNELVHSRAGQSFCNDIIKAAGIIYPNLGTDIESAVQYCYSKNKRNGDGTVTQHWYLPAIDEIEEIVMSQNQTKLEEYSYTRFPDFRAKNYWSSQPAYKNNFFFVERLLGDRWGNYMKDNDERARSTSVTYINESGLGPDDPDNYKKKTSGMSGYYKYIDADYSLLGSLSNTSEHDVKGDGSETFSGSNNAHSLPSTTLSKWNYDSADDDYDGGALLRTDMARVRCVYKP